MSVAPLYISNLGLACPVGQRAVNACAAIRARINRFQESRYRDNTGEPIVCSEFTRLPANMMMRERVLALLSLAITDAFQGLDAAQLSQIPLLVSTAEPERPGGVSEVIPHILKRLQQEHGLRLSATHSSDFPQGSTGGFRALADARALLKKHPQLPGCLVAGVDSMVNAPALSWLDSQDRLKRPGQPDGVIPGEAAACILVTRKPLQMLRPVAAMGLGFALEMATVTSEEPLRGRAMAEASRTALKEAGIDMAGIGFRLSDASGEGYAFKELALTLARVLRTRKETMPLWLPAETLGETGAASAVIGLVITAMAMHRGYAPGAQAIHFAANYSGDRAVAVLRAT